MRFTIIITITITINITIIIPWFIFCCR